MSAFTSYINQMHSRTCRTWWSVRSGQNHEGLRI